MLRNQICVITGGSGGLGIEFAQIVLEHGAKHVGKKSDWSYIAIYVQSALF